MIDSIIRGPHAPIVSRSCSSPSSSRNTFRMPVGLDPLPCVGCGRQVRRDWTRRAGPAPVPSSSGALTPAEKPWVRQERRGSDQASGVARGQCGYLHPRRGFSRHADSNVSGFRGHDLELSFIDRDLAGDLDLGPDVQLFRSRKRPMHIVPQQQRDLSRPIVEGCLDASFDPSSQTIRPCTPTLCRSGQRSACPGSEREGSRSRWASPRS